MAKLTVNKTNRPEGDEVYIPGFGLYKNGATYEIEGDEDIVVGDDTDYVPSAPVGSNTDAPSLEEDLWETDTEEDD